MAPKFFRIIRRIIIFAMICVLGNMLWKNHTTPHYETPAAQPASDVSHDASEDSSHNARNDSSHDESHDKSR
ncbi:MAG TPA: hypothetical protein V6C89_16640 [Drouetiella sp.]|jgi:cytoskeletal protein RodZ